MNCAKCFALLLLCIAGSGRPVLTNAPVAPRAIVQDMAAPPFMSAEQLKPKLARNEPVAVIDVRNTQSYLNSNRIKDSMYIKLRRLASRITMPPLKDLPRDRDVVTYCACPHDEASIRAAQIFLDAGFKRVHVLQGGWQMWV